MRLLCTRPYYKFSHTHWINESEAIARNENRNHKQKWKYARNHNKLCVSRIFFRLLFGKNFYSIRTQTHEVSKSPTGNAQLCEHVEYTSNTKRRRRRKNHPTTHQITRTNENVSNKQQITSKQASQQSKRAQANSFRPISRTYRMAFSVIFVCQEY